jgi:hypothetical protein
MPFLGDTPSTTSITAGAPSTLSDTQVFGSGAEADVKIIFDGNAVDYHIGVDDSADTLNFGKGSTLGTTTSQTFDTNGIIQRPLQTSFLINSDESSGGTNTNITKDAYRTDSMGEEIFDTNADFDNTNDVFTAPVTGIYKLKGQSRFDFVQNDGNYLFELVTSDNTFVNDYNHDILSGDMDFSVFEIMADVPMDAGDTAKLQWKQVGGTQDVDKGTSDNPNQINTYMTGFLIG